MPHTQSAAQTQGPCVPNCNCPRLHAARREEGANANADSPGALCTRPRRPAIPVPASTAKPVAGPSALSFDPATTHSDIRCMLSVAPIQNPPSKTGQACELESKHADPHEPSSMTITKHRTISKPGQREEAVERNALQESGSGGSRNPGAGSAGWATRRMASKTWASRAAPWKRSSRCSDA